MSSHQHPYHCSGPSQIYFESDSESSVARQRPPPGQSWPPTATISDQSGCHQPHQSFDTVGNSLEVHDAAVCSYHNFDNPASNPSPLSDPQDMNLSFNYHGPGSSLPSTSLQDPGFGTDATHATYSNDDPHFHFFDQLPFYYHAFDHAPYGPVYYPSQDLLHDVHQHPAQDFQTSRNPAAPLYPHPPSTQFLLPSHGVPVYGTDTRAAYPTPDSLTLDGVSTARTNAIAGQHSHPSPVATSPSNETSAPGPSRPLPSSPERKRSLPLSAADEPSPARRVVPRHDRADYPGHSRGNSDVHGRGPLIPQERYTTSTISSFNAPDQVSITFNLENPDQTGIPIIDILNKTDGFARIRDSAEAFNMGKKTFTLRVQWPGYKSWSKTIAAMDWKKSRGPITRVKLAEAVATAIRDLFEKYREERYDTDYAEWNVGPNGIQLDQVCLVALHQVSRGSWQPRLCLLGTRY